jgi:hypothetical protein
VISTAASEARDCVGNTLLGTLSPLDPLAHVQQGPHVPMYDVGQLGVLRNDCGLIRAFLEISQAHARCLVLGDHQKAASSRGGSDKRF